MKELFALLIVCSFVLSCNDTIIEPENYQNQSNVIVFDNYKELYCLMDQLNEISEFERVNLERERGFKSFGQECDEYYFSFDFDNVSSLEHLRSDVKFNHFITI